ncbi:hypothetical protein [Alkalilacustris brevis]|uniref:hypothetical protein n=1 Tax=Alkalilacustris brevis TaxID=2026338 RepID=UPI00138FB4C6|nr:hypothetical protein [Alkalilacustris brevis]
MPLAVGALASDNGFKPPAFAGSQLILPKLISILAGEWSYVFEYDFFKALTNKILASCRRTAYTQKGGWQERSRTGHV